jgi:E3 ubiquitin-protein ligase SHPRH
MLAILFPHMYEDVEYLIPDATTTNGTNVSMGPDAEGQSSETRSSVRPRQENAVAGPSRLRL